jgi:pimeloyl-ACP methyl ester carboxylesterase
MRRVLRLRRDGLRRPALLLVAACVFASPTSAAFAYVVATDTPAAVPPGLTFVRTGAYTTRYQAWGRPSAHPVALVHGAFESVATWRPVARVLAPSTRVEAYDLEGYGYTDHVGPYTTESLASQLGRFIVARHLAHPVLVGHSLGAGVIARFVLDHPGVAAGVVFVDGDGLSVTYPGTWVPGAVPEPLRTAAYRAVVRDRGLVSAIFGLACGPGCPPLTPAQLDDLQRTFLVAGAEQALLAYVSRPVVGVTADELGHLRSVGPPALVVFGADDD